MVRGCPRDGSEVLFTDLSEQSGNDYSVYVRKSDGSPAVRLTGGGYATDITPDGKWAMVILPDDPAGRLQLCPWDRGRHACCTGTGYSRDGPNGSRMDIVFCCWPASRAGGSCIPHGCGWFDAKTVVAGSRSMGGGCAGRTIIHCYQNGAFVTPLLCRTAAPSRSPVFRPRNFRSGGRTRSMYLCRQQPLPASTFIR